ncbi:plexin-C1-like [Gambusia affinis]|uniref:plexin-C1-like n=1 Tax=Gambusia affinis TaxID=33528 RepID=UPI001CDC6DA7|nr:plexin-C1-like [Gambusia affinis]
MEDSCSWASELTHNTQKDVCLEIEAGMNISIPDVISVTPSVVSLYGKNHALLSGHNLNDVIGVRISTHMDCSPQESPVWNNTGVSLTFHIPTTETRRVVKMCVLLPDGSCHGNTKISYQSSPVCTDIVPRSSWRSGKRKVKLIGTHLEFVDGLMQSHAQHQVLLPRNRSSQETLTYDTPTAENSQICCSTVFMKVANQTVACLVKLTYYPDPEFTGFTTERLGNDARVVIHKSSDKLEMTAAELLVWVEGEKQYPCIKVLENHNKTDSFICDIQGVNNTNFRAIKIIYGDTTVWMQTLTSLHLGLLILHFLLKCSILTVLVVFCQWQKKQASSDY